MRSMLLTLAVLFAACGANPGAAEPADEPGEAADATEVARALLDDPVMRAALVQLLADELGGGAGAEGEGEGECGACPTAPDVATELAADEQARNLV